MILSSLRHATQRHLQSRRHYISGSSISIRKRSLPVRLSRVSRSIFNHHDAIHNINARFISRAAGNNFCHVNVVCKRGRNYNAGAMQSNNHVFFSTSSSSDHDVNELSKLTRNELRDKLKEKGLSTNGLKAELVERLAATGGNIKVHPLVINPADDLDYEIYSSPQALHMKLNRKFHEIECEPITINNETWYTARYTTKYGDYPSGTFGTDFLKKINPDLVEEDCFTINGKNYYRSKEVALEAAAARVLDQLSFDRKRKFEKSP